MLIQFNSENAVDSNLDRCTLSQSTSETAIRVSCNLDDVYAGPARVDKGDWAQLSAPDGRPSSRSIILWVSPPAAMESQAEDCGGFPSTSAFGDRPILHERILPVVNNLPLYLPPARHCPRQLFELDFLRLPSLKNRLNDVRCQQR